MTYLYLIPVNTDMITDSAALSMTHVWLSPPNTKLIPRPNSEFDQFVYYKHTQKHVIVKQYDVQYIYNQQNMTMMCYNRPGISQYSDNTCV